MAIIVTNSLSGDGMAIVDHGGGGECIAVVTNERPDMPEIPPLPANNTST